MAILDVNQSTTVGNFEDTIKSLNEAKLNAKSAAEKDALDKFITKYTQSKDKLITICKNDIAKGIFLGADANVKVEVGKVTRENFRALSLERWNKIVATQGLSHEEKEIKSGDKGQGAIDFLEGKSGINLMTGVKAALTTAAIGALSSLNIGAFAGLWGLSLPASVPASISLFSFVPEIISGLATLNPVLGLAAGALVGIGAVAVIKKIFGPEIKKIWTNVKVAHKVRKLAETSQDKISSEQDIKKFMGDMDPETFQKKAEKEASDDLNRIKNIDKLDKDGKPVIDPSTGNPVKISQFEVDFKNEMSIAKFTKLDDLDKAVRKVTDKYAKNRYATYPEMDAIIKEEITPYLADNFQKEALNLVGVDPKDRANEVKNLKNKYIMATRFLDTKEMDTILKQTGVYVEDPNLGTYATELNTDTTFKTAGTQSRTAFDAFKAEYEAAVKLMASKNTTPAEKVKAINDLQKIANKPENFLDKSDVKRIKNKPTKVASADDLSREDKLKKLCEGMVDLLKEIHKEVVLDNTMTQAQVNKLKKKLETDHGLEADQLKHL